MTLEIRPYRPEESDAFNRVPSIVFGNYTGIPRSETPEAQRGPDLLPPELSLCAFEDGTLATTYAAYPFTMRLNGAKAPAAGVTCVGTLPTFRRRGHLRKIMEHDFQRRYEQRMEPIAILLASIAAIYQRYGYAVCSSRYAYTIDPKLIKTVIFSSGGVGMTAALGGHVDVWVGTTGGALQHMRGSKARVLGITAAQRQDGGLENVPTFKEQGIDAEYYAWRGFVAPRGITAAQVAFWDQAFARIIKSDEWKKELADNGWADGFVGAADIRRRLDTEFALLGGLLNELGLVTRGAKMN